MQRLMDTGLIVLLLATLGMPVNATPESSQAATQAPVKMEVKAKVAQTDLQPDSQKAESAPLSERDRLILERRLQQLIPAEQ